MSDESKLKGIIEDLTGRIKTLERQHVLFEAGWHRSKDGWEMPSEYQPDLWALTVDEAIAMLEMAKRHRSTHKKRPG